MTILDFVRLTRHNFLLLLAAIGLGILVMAGYSFTRPTLYSATSTGYVVVGSSGTLADAYNGTTLGQGKAQSYLPLVNSTNVAQRIIDDLGIQASPGSIAGSLSAEVVPGTVLFKVSAVSTDPVRARDVADAAIKATSEEANKLETLNMDGTSRTESVVRIVPIEQAGVAGTPFSPNWTRNLLIGAAAGLLFGYLAALLRMGVDSRIRTQADVETVTGAGVLAIIPKVTGIDETGDITSPDSFAGEAVRQLRTNLRFVNVDHPPRKIVLTSANPGEGKSTIASNLARLLAQAGTPAILIDADLRRPTLSKKFDTDSSIGLTQVLAGDVELEAALVQVAPGLLLLPAGRIPPNPSELVGSQRMHALLDALAQTHTVIVDAPPLLPVTDAGLLAATADGAILVSQVGKTHKEQLRLCAKILGRVNAKLLGSVLNMAPRKGIGSVVYGYGYGSYEQRYYYTSDGVKKKVRRRKPSRGGGQASRAAKPTDGVPDTGDTTMPDDIMPEQLTARRSM